MRGERRGICVKGELGSEEKWMERGERVEVEEVKISHQVQVIKKRQSTQ